MSMTNSTQVYYDSLFVYISNTSTLNNMCVVKLERVVNNLRNKVMVI